MADRYTITLPDVYIAAVQDAADGDIVSRPVAAIRRSNLSEVVNFWVEWVNTGSAVVTVIATMAGIRRIAAAMITRWRHRQTEDAVTIVASRAGYPPVSLTLDPNAPDAEDELLEFMLKVLASPDVNE